MLKKYLITCLTLLYSSFSAGQEQSSDTIRFLNVFEVVAPGQSRFSAGSRTMMVDSALLIQSTGPLLHQVLAYQPQLTFKTNGPSGSSTLSFRGTQPTQSAVLWNGFNISSPSMGMTDISLLPAVLFDDIRLQYGGESALYGSGHMGGSLQLGNRDGYSHPFSSVFTGSYGSAGNKNAAIRMAAGNRKLYISSAMMMMDHPNRFHYKTPDGESHTMRHALIKQTSLLGQAGYIPAKNQQVTAAFWYQSAFRELPASLVMAQSSQTQDDRSVRTTLRWKYSGNRMVLNSGFAFFDEMMHYRDDASKLDATYKLSRTAWEGDVKLMNGKQLVMSMGGSAEYLSAHVPYYNGRQNQAEGALFITAVYRSENHALTANLNLRQDFAQGYSVPFCPAAGLQWQAFRNLNIRFSASRNFRIPTMNDRFWYPGGNPDLKPEASWNQDIYVEYVLKETETCRIQLQSDIYNIIINNNIQWIPVGNAIWSPVNNRQVWSRGIETGGRCSGLFRKIGYQIVLSGAYTPSTYSKSDQQNDNVTGKQLIYMPAQNIFFSAGMQYGRFNLNFRSVWHGRRYTASDHSSSLPSYQVAGLSSGYEVLHKKLKFNLQAIAENLFDAAYQVVQYFPEPGINIQLKLTVQYQKTVQQ